MTVPGPPYPAVIDFADILPGMQIQTVGVYPAPDSGTLTVTLTGTVATVDQDTQTGVFTNGLPLSAAASWAGVAATVTNSLMAEFTGDPAEPAIDAVVKAPDGTIYQRQGTDPTESAWYTINSTTAVSWSDLTADGEATVLGGDT